MPSVEGDDNGVFGFGVAGKSTTGVGVVGISEESTGVQGTSMLGGVGVAGSSENAEGVLGISKLSHGVRGESASASHAGVHGNNLLGGVGVAGQSTTGNGVFGECDTGIGVAGFSAQGNGVSGQSKQANGVLGLTDARDGSGVFGSNMGEGNGVSGFSEAGFGVFGQTNHRGGEKMLVAGVTGQCNGLGYGLLGISSDGLAAVAGFTEQGDGVLGETRNSSAAGIRGVNFAQGAGVRGEGNVGVVGVSTSSLNTAAGVLGEDRSSGGVGVQGVSTNGIGVVGYSGNLNLAPIQKAGVVGASDIGPGVYAFSNRIDKPAVFAWGPDVAIQTVGSIRAVQGGINAINSPGLAGNFVGAVKVTGLFSATVKLFKIDHPLDPGNKYLNHASVESSEMKTIYDGIAVLDAHGEAFVELPDWFDALNTSVRYQLTPIGVPAPDLHIAEEVSDNRFKIAGGPPRLKVCWQVTGVRHDSFARAQPLLVEEEKSAEERGYFLHPEHLGYPGERGIAWAQNSELMRGFDELQTPPVEKEPN